MQSLLTTIRQHADGMDPSMRQQLHMSMYRISISALHHYNPQAPPIPRSYGNNPREQRADRATAHLLLSGFLPEVSSTFPVYKPIKSRHVMTMWKDVQNYLIPDQHAHTHAAPQLVCCSTVFLSCNAAMLQMPYSHLQQEGTA